MKLKSFLALLLATWLFLISGCSGKSKNQAPQSPAVSQTEENSQKTMSLLYRSNDSLNPYSAKSTYNRQLSLLMFDPLVKMDYNFQPSLILAESVSVVGKECKVILKDARFTDGTKVTSEDIIYSYKLALEAEHLPYCKQLLTVKSVSSEGNNIVKFHLNKSDPYFANLLDFPVIKKESENRKDLNNIVLPPVGSGRYTFDSYGRCLVANENYHFGVMPIKTINLVFAPDDAVVKYNLESGNISVFYTDMADGVVPPMIGSATKLPLNNLVYLGINMKKSSLSNSKMRYILSSVLDRESICSNAYFEYAVPAAGLFNSVWKDSGKLQNINSKSDLQNVVAYFEEMGYNSKDGKGILTDSKGKPLSFNLVAYKDNKRRLKVAEFVAEQLLEVGIEIKINALDWDSYVKAINESNFDLYIAEVKLLNNMDVSDLVTSTGALAFGIPKMKAGIVEGKADESQPNSYVPLLDSAVEGFYSEELSIADIINAFNAEMPIIPICHTVGLTVTDKGLTTDPISSISDVFFGIGDIK